MPYVAHDNLDEGDITAGSRVCRKCGTRKPMDRFHFANEGKHRRRSCKECDSSRRKARLSADPAAAKAKARWKNLRSKYNLTPESFAAMLERQEYGCKVCRVKLAEQTTHVDHDHQTDQVRGLLCFNCNVGIGHLRDDPALLERAASYVRLARQDYDFEEWRKVAEAELAALGFPVDLTPPPRTPVGPRRRTEDGRDPRPELWKRAEPEAFWTPAGRRFGEDNA